MNPLTMAAGGIVIAAAAGLAGYGKGYSAGSNSVQQEWDKEKARQMAEYAAAQEAARKKEQAWQASADLLRQEKEREIRNINARATALSNSLRNRAERPEAGGVREAACACSGASGAQLARGDAEFLAGFAADAERNQAALKQCVAQYNAAR